MTPSRGIYVRRGARVAWVAEQSGRHLCGCGCGDPVLVTTAHYPDVPKFRHGHNSRVQNPNSIEVSREQWAAEQQGKHHCACGCGSVIRILREHHSEGIPKYANNHHPRPRPSRPVSPPQPCACGCGTQTAPGNRYVLGHNSIPQPLRETFLAKTSPLDGDACWPWYGEHKPDGYALLRHNRKHYRAARLSFTLFRGEIPPEHEPDHTCRIRSCVNPWHLDAVTHGENIRRKSLTAEEHRALAPLRPPDWTP